ncbi:conserved hypothetical protein, partial [Ricinus communis]
MPVLAAVARVHAQIAVACRQRVDVGGKRMLIAAARTVDEPDGMLVSRTAAIDQQAVQHGDHRRDADAGRQQHHRPLRALFKREFAARPHHLDLRARRQMRVQPRRHRAITLDADAVMTAIRRVGNRVAADLRRRTLARPRRHPQRNKLARHMRRHAHAVGRLQVEGAHVRAFLHHVGNGERTPALDQRGGGLHAVRLGPVAGARHLGSRLRGAPAKRQCADVTHHFTHVEAQQLFRASKRLQLRAVPDDLSLHRKMQHVAALEVDEQQAGAWIGQQVAHGVEEEVADEFRRRQRALVVHPHKAGTTAAMGHVDATAASRVGRHVGAGDEEGVGTGNQRAVGVAQRGRTQHLHYAATGGRRRVLAVLDVLRAVAEALRDGDAQRVMIGGHHLAVDAVAAARGRRQPQAANVRAGTQLSLQRIARQHAAVDVQRARVRRHDKAGVGGQHGGPWLAIGVQRAEEEDGSSWKSRGAGPA